MKSFSLRHDARRPLLALDLDRVIAAVEAVVKTASFTTMSSRHQRSMIVVTSAVAAAAAELTRQLQAETARAAGDKDHPAWKEPPVRRVGRASNAEGEGDVMGAHGQRRVRPRVIARCPPPGADAR